MKVKILRTKYDKEGTLGKLFIDGEFFCATLERPNLNNEAKISCIPEGNYKLVRDKTGRYKGFAIKNVPNRQNIEVHQGNCIDDIEGCVLVGKKITEGQTPYKGKVYKYWLSSSSTTLEALIKQLLPECDLEITSSDTICKFKKSSQFF